MSQGLQYLDSADGRLEKEEGGEAVAFDGSEVDRIYVGAPDELTVGSARCALRVRTRCAFAAPALGSVRTGTREANTKRRQGGRSDVGAPGELVVCM